MKNLFKAQTKDGRKWIFGNLIDDGMKNKRYFILPSDADNYDEYEEVRPDTVCQSTGITDINGNNIYEGDILLNTKTDYEYYVQYVNGAFICFHTKLKDYDGTDLRWGGIWRFEELDFEIKITGNIHNN